MEGSDSSRRRQLSHLAAHQLRTLSFWIVLAALAAVIGLALPATGRASEVEVSETPIPGEEWTPSCSPECEVIVAPAESEALGIEYEGGGPRGGLTPQELRSAYGLPEHGGSTSTIAVVDGPSDATAESDMNAYRKYFGLPECTKASGCFKQVNERGEPSAPTSSGGWAIEISLDLDMVSAACPECHIILVEAKEERLARAEANDEAVKLGATAVSNSWNYGFEKGNPANSGVTCSGSNCITAEEEASYDPHFNHPGTPILFSGGDYGYAVRYPTVSPNVISVGGTALMKAANSRGWAESVWSNAAYGVDQKGRGTGSGCSLYEAKPKWETDSPCTKRIENDIAADADPRTGPEVYYAGGWYGPVGGTSASAPFIAGVEGLSSSSARSMGAEAMWLAGSAKSLIDITEGNDGTCTPPSEDAYWCTAGIGYDGPTGNGVPNGAIEAGQPTVASVTPSEGPEAGGTSVTITGTNFEGATAVNFGATAATSFTVKSSTTIEATSPAHAAGTVDVTVTSAKGTSATGSGDHFTYRAKPAVTNVQPNAGPLAGGTKVMISGTGFTNASKVSFGATVATSFTVISDSWISAVSPSGSGTVDVTVTTPGGTSATGTLDRFKYHSGTALGWGDDRGGELGAGTTSGPETCAEGACNMFAIAPNGSFSSEVTAVSAGTDHSLALLANGTVMAWGGDSEGEMCTASGSSTPVSVTELSEVSAVSAGGYDTLALLKDGTVRACGRNTYGELGNGNTTGSKTPVKVSGLSEVTAVSAGETHSLALLKNGKVMAWGQGSAGELGNGSTSNSSVPVEVSGITEAVAVSAGGEYSLALLKSGKVMAWGSGASGKLGNGGTTNSTTPVEVSGLTEVTAISAGSAHALALQKSGSVQSWGANQSGQLGTGSCCEFSKTPVKVSGITEATAVSAGFHSLAMLKSGSVMDWGRDSQGQLGVGSYTGPETCEFEGSPRSCSKVPVTVSGLTNAVGIEGGVNFALSVGTTPSFTQTIDSGHSLNAVSCIPGTTDCVAGDSPGNAFYSEKPSTTGSATWKPWTGPGAGASHAVTCPTTTLCLLAAGEQEKGGNLYYATSLGGAWTLSYSPAYGVDAISCASTSFCVDGQDGLGYFRYSTTPASSSWTLEQQGSSSMNGVSCLSSSFCAMVDGAGNLYVGASTTQIESSTWTVTNVDGSNALNGVACTSSTSCLAVDGVGNVLKLAISGGTATTTKLNIDSTNSLTGIACTTGSTCVAVDNLGNVFVSTNNGANWTKQYAIGTKQTGVSCASTSLCVATGSTGAVTTFNPR